MSYTIDIYRKEIKPTKQFFDFALFVALFPQLVAGPIERAKRLLPQIESPRKIRLNWFYEGCYLIFWGLFEKIFIADNLAKIVDPTFEGPPYEGAKVLLSVYAFAFQIFCDFDGYSNIARGIARLMGFDIMVNFRLPYFATNPQEFWRRWHISLSTWLRDYLYIPLGGNRRGNLITLRNLAITMLLGGLWHGAAWTFVIWGAYHGILLVSYRLFHIFIEKIPYIRNIFAQRIWFSVRVIFFFHLICMGWLIFRAQSITQVLDMLYSLFFNFSFSPDLLDMGLYLLFFISVLIFIQLIQYVKDDLMIVMKWPAYRRTILVLVIVYLFLYVMTLSEEALIGGGSEFIYFQF